MDENFLERIRIFILPALACLVLVVNATGFFAEAHAADVSSPPAVDQVVVPTELEQMQTFRRNAFEAEIMVDGLNAFLLRHVHDRKWSPGAHDAWIKWMDILNNRLEMLISDAENYRPSMSAHKDPLVVAIFRETENRVQALEDTESKLIVMEAALVIKWLCSQFALVAHLVSPATCILEA